MRSQGMDRDPVPAGHRFLRRPRESRSARGSKDRPVAEGSPLLRAAVAALTIGAVLAATEQHTDLGALVCDMEPETIVASDPSVLENLKLCPALTGAQRDALNAVLLGGGTAYGDPSSWDLQTLQNLGPLVLALNQTTLNLVAEAAREAFGSSITAAYGSQGRSQREKSLTLLRAFAAASASSRPRLKRSADREPPGDLLPLPAGCLSAPITASTIAGPFLLIDYDTREQFDLCLSNEVLKANLGALLEQPLTVEYLLVVKAKLEQIYPSGIPEEQLKLLGPLSRQYTVQEISLWPVTSSDTLSALLNPSDGKWEAPQVQQLLSRYLTLGGTLTGPLLRKIGGRHLCNLQEEWINQISPEAIQTAGQLNISSCSQTKKDQLYRKARVAFAGQAGTRAYYCRIWPYLGGAPAKDLKDLAQAGIAIDMDMDTFLALNPNELQKLSVVDVKNLLGENLPSLKEAENETSVMRWVKRQSQRELDCTLGIGLQGGTEEPGPTRTAPPPHPTASASITPTATIPVPTTLPTVAISSPPHTNSSTSPHKAPTPSALSPAPPKSTPPHAYTTARPALTTSSIIPCSIHQSATSHKATPSSVKPNATSPSSVPLPALTRRATTSASAGTTPNTSTPLVSMNPPAPGGTTHPTPATHHTVMPSTLVPNSTSATAATETNLPSHKPTPTPNSTVSTQKSVTSSTTTLLCKTGAPPALLGPSSTTHSGETTKKPPVDVPEPPRPTPDGYINLQPEAGSGSRLSSCLLHVLTTVVGSSLLRGLL
ncbi:mesothelin-like protein [Falco naumanni]|uniref:mesothelin-like protein n=1 Tax=Falco naumanni TaxID=148594 RepID=UPI001ADE1FEE|nr:mesothelin-like protein [Falco naumanni]